jgi:hypothetical protein
MVSVAVAHLPTAVSLLLLEALFMQISGVSLALAWPLRLCLLRVLLCASCCYKLSPFQAHWGRWHCTRFLRLPCLFTAHVGSESSSSPGEFSSLCHSHSDQLLVAGPVSPLPPEPLWPARLIYSPGKDSLPLSSALRAPHPLATCLFCYYCLLLSFSFFPWVGVGLSRGLSWSGPGLSVGVPRTA